MLGATSPLCPTGIHYMCVWAWGYLPAPWCPFLPSPQPHVLVSSGGIPGLHLPTSTALGEHRVREGKAWVVCLLLWQKVPVVVLSSWGVASIICHGRLFSSSVNSLNSSAVWSMAQPACRPTGGRPRSRDHDLGLGSSADGNCSTKHVWCVSNNSWCWGEILLNLSRFRFSGCLVPCAQICCFAPVQWEVMKPGCQRQGWQLLAKWGDRKQFSEVMISENLVSARKCVKLTG